MYQRKGSRPLVSKDTQRILSPEHHPSRPPGVAASALRATTCAPAPPAALVPRTRFRARSPGFSPVPTPRRQRDPRQAVPSGHRGRPSLGWTRGEGRTGFSQLPRSLSFGSVRFGRAPQEATSWKLGSSAGWRGKPRSFHPSSVLADKARGSSGESWSSPS
jgi:hypothetical protein